MTMRTNYFLLFAILLGVIPMSYTHANDSIPKSVILYTPYTKISVSPGASIDYSIDLINNTDQLTNANLSVSGLSSSWKHEMKSGGWSLSQLSVLPKEKKTFNLKVEVPLKVNKGNYHFVVYAGNAKLPLDVVVAQKGTYQTEFTTDQPNMQGNSKSTFTFSATLKNQTADQQLYALMANAPRGWNVVFKPNYKQATSAQVEANSTQNVSIDITPPANVEAGSYKIPVRAATGTTSAELELEVVVTGSYQMELTTPRGLLSTDVTAGDVKKIELEVLNISNSQEQAGAYALVLGEVDGARQLPVIIGAAEAQAMLISLKGIVPPRPLTHNLFASCLEVLGVNMMRALIYRVDNGVFYSYIYLKADDAIIRMDARTSDAVAMALRMKAPIFIYEEILESEQLKTGKESEAGSIAPMGENPSPHEDEFFHGDTMEMLQKALQEAIANENYERAAHIRDEISKRKEQ